MMQGFPAVCAGNRETEGLAEIEDREGLRYRAPARIGYFRKHSYRLARTYLQEPACGWIGG
jgi:hypothetical protein